MKIPKVHFHCNERNHTLIDMQVCCFRLFPVITLNFWSTLTKYCPFLNVEDCLLLILLLLRDGVAIDMGLQRYHHTCNWTPTKVPYSDPPPPFLLHIYFQWFWMQRGISSNLAPVTWPLTNLVLQCRVEYSHHTQFGAMQKPFIKHHIANKGVLRGPETLPYYSVIWSI